MLTLRAGVFVVVRVPGAGYGGAVARLARVLRRRRRVRGGRPAAVRRAVSSWRLSHAVVIRWLRVMIRQVVNSSRGARPMIRHQPRVMLLVAGSLMVAKMRSAPVRLA